ncbi:MAG: universal stress protein [Myxococcaceae bacterium]|jgi:nucleotide-binding universal stress UspA family protein|nr:universal stress protein [Myxococcaceae bacterium]MCA3013640.1 universal stress protein [Myxococcaceae bacterium]
MKKILVAIDGSDASMHAARTAATIATGLGASLTLAHVVPPPFVPPEVPFGVQAWTDEAVKAGERLLEAASRELGVACERQNLSGSPAERLADLAEQGSFDLLVVGSKGRGAVSRVLIGSVTDRLVHICKRPVLVVR